MTTSPISVIFRGSNNSDAVIDIGDGDENGTDTFAYPSWWCFDSYTEPSGIISFRLVTWGIVIPVIGVVGFFANALNVAVLACLIRRKTSPVYRILLAMATADTLVTMLFLLNSFFIYTRPDPVLFSVDVARLSDAGRIFYYSLSPAMNVFGFTSNWCTVAMATFRFVAVYFPLAASKWCTRRRATVTVAAIVTVAVLLTVVPEALSAHRALSNASFPDLPREYRVAYAVANDVLPWTLCVILVSLLLITFRKPWSNMKITSRHEAQKSGKRRQLTVTLVSTAAWFVITTAPSTITVVIAFWDRDSIHSSIPLSRLFYVGQILVLMNFNGNFFFYSFINSSHRQQLKELLRISSPGKRLKNKRACTSSKQTFVTAVTSLK